MSVLEFGAAENSYMPQGLKLSRHVGVGANKALMDKNSALTESLVVNLNDVVEEQGVNSEELSKFGAESFDAIVMANTIDFLSSPREVFRSAWYLLKPGGIMMVPFVNKDAYTSKFERAQTKMWRDFNDDQHMWVCGSFFQFSAGDGWEGLKGFDISPESAKKGEGAAALLKQGGGMNMFVVQARKAKQDEAIDPSNPEKSFRSKMWLMPTLEDRDKKLLAPRLTRSYEFMKSDEDINALAKNVQTLPKVYESLIKMDQFAFPFGMQAQLATDLVTDTNFNGNDEQIKALKMGKFVITC
jgi:SAM-dependent methyltransferase